MSKLERSQVGILFAHGAGASSQSEWMRGWTARLGVLGEVTPFDYPYMKEGRKLPDRMPRLLEAHLAALTAAQANHPGPWFLAGKSMGSRVGCHLALTERVAGIVCFGYPLIGVSKKRPVRDQVLLDLRTPILFVQGTRDKLCPLDRLEQVRGRMAAPSTLYVVEGGDHSLQIPRRDSRCQGEVDEGISEAVARFLGC